MKRQGVVKKLIAEEGDPVHYQLPLGDASIPLNELLNKKITLTFLQIIECLGCGERTKKSFNQGYCYRCFISLAQCDRCLTSPELCHYHLGTCREPLWGKEHCMIDHTVYLANSSGLKVGVTRSYQQKTRWMDQGAIQAIPIGRVKSRLDAGQVEVSLKKYLMDKTNWRKMLSGPPPPINMEEKMLETLEHWPQEIAGALPSSKTHSFAYPVLQYPQKVVSHNLDKDPVLEDVLMGIKGQYLIFEKSVINMRKYGGYRLSFEVR